MPFLAVDRPTAHKKPPAGCGGVACSDRDGGEHGEQDGAAGNTRAWHTCFVIHARTHPKFWHTRHERERDQRERGRGREILLLIKAMFISAFLIIRILR